MRKIGWFDIKTKFKKTIRSIFYTNIGQEIVCYIIIFYIRFVHATSKVKIIGSNYAFDRFKNDKSVIFATWHHEIMMVPFIPAQIKKFNKTKKIAALTSKHGDGRFVGIVLEKLGAYNISGSTRDGRKASRGIDMHGLKEIIRSVKNGLGVAITPDGPRGPSKKVNGEIIKVAEITGAPIVLVGVGYSKFRRLNTWDKFKIPLPFGKIHYYYSDPFSVGKDLDETEIKNLNLKLEQEINLAETEANQF